MLSMQTTLIVVLMYFLRVKRPYACSSSSYTIIKRLGRKVANAVALKLSVYLFVCGFACVSALEKMLE